jgi:tetratricopeptide (TPR) repeat protein
MLVCNDPMMRIVMGRNYESLSCYDKAEEMYLQAFHMQPNRLYPLYRMMLLQEATGDSIRIKEYANKVLEFDPKVQSPAIREMKWKAKEIINQM